MIALETAESPHVAVVPRRMVVSDELHSEEDVKIKFLIPLLEERGYTTEAIDFDVAIEIHEGRKRKTIFADVVVYTDASKQTPLLVCETKAPTEALNRSAREQAISYARLLPRIAPLVLLTNGSQVQVYRSLDKSRVEALPDRESLAADLVGFAISPERQEALREEAKHELFIIDDVRTFKSILRSCHNEIRNNEGLDPTAAFDEMSKVLFCKLYEEKENPKGNRFRLSVFDDSLERLNFNVVSKILEEAKEAAGYREIFSSDAAIQLKDRTVRKIVKLLEGYDLGLTAFDVKGEAFEFFLGETFTGGLGEYFTPRNIVEFMVEALNPKIGDKIIDPFCGTGGFLIYAFEVVSEKIRLQEFSKTEKNRWRIELSNRSLFGTDWKERTSQACKMNMMVHGDGSSGIFMHDGLTNVDGKIEEDAFDLCITNPPFGSIESDSEVLNRFEVGSGRNSQDRVILAVERSLRLVRPGGYIGIVVIDGVLNNDSTRYVRDYIRRHAWVRGVVSLPKETFEGYGSRAKTSVLFLERKEKPGDGEQGPAFMAVASNTGLAPNGDEMPGNELPDVLLDYRAFQKGEDLEPHSKAWVCRVTDRLDAEFYSAYREVCYTDLPLLQERIGDGLQSAQESLGTLADIGQQLTSISMVSARIGDLLEEVRDRHKVEPNEIYRLLGVRWWGGGPFVREEKLGKDIKAGSLFKASAGDVVYNRLFAFRGSFGVLGQEHDGCSMSGEFPTFRVKDGVPDAALLAQYIVQRVNSPRCLAAIDAQSTGSTKTSRNRFNQKLFLDLEIPVPRSRKDLATVVSLLGEADRLRRQQEAMVEMVKELRDGVLDSLPASSEEPETGTEGDVTRDDFFHYLEAASSPRQDDHSEGQPDKGSS